MNTESLQRISHFLFWFSIIFPTLGAMSGVARFYVDRQEKRISAASAAEIRRHVETLADYTEVARLNFMGTSGMAGAGLVEQTPISRALEGAVNLSGTKLQYKCDEASIQVFNDLVARYPRFPFSHYALAFCLQRQGDAAWKDHALKAVEILKRTTAIDGHHPNHDQALQELSKALSL